MIVENKYCREKDGRPQHQKSRFFIASKRVSLSLDTWPSSLQTFITEYIYDVWFGIS